MREAGKQKNGRDLGHEAQVVVPRFLVGEGRWGLVEVEVPQQKE